MRDFIEWLKEADMFVKSCVAMGIGAIALMMLLILVTEPTMLLVILGIAVCSTLIGAVILALISLI
jgi:hypothetical protein